MEVLSLNTVARLQQFKKILALFELHRITHACHKPVYIQRCLLTCCTASSYVRKFTIYTVLWYRVMSVYIQGYTEVFIDILQCYNVHYLCCTTVHSNVLANMPVCLSLTGASYYVCVKMMANLFSDFSMFYTSYKNQLYTQPERPERCVVGVVMMANFFFYNDLCIIKKISLTYYLKDLKVMWYCIINGKIWCTCTCMRTCHMHVESKYIYYHYNVKVKSLKKKSRLIYGH
jgi:hypothetical protein